MTPTSRSRREGPVISGNLIQNEPGDFKRVVITFACRNTRRSRCFGLKPPEANMSVKNTASQVALALASGESHEFHGARI